MRAAHRPHQLTPLELYPDRVLEQGLALFLAERLVAAIPRLVHVRLPSSTTARLPPDQLALPATLNGLYHTAIAQITDRGVDKKMARLIIGAWVLHDDDEAEKELADALKGAGCDDAAELAGRGREAGAKLADL